LGNQFLSTLEAIYWTCVEYWNRAAAVGNIDVTSASTTTDDTKRVSSPSSSSSSSTPYERSRHFDNLMLFYAAFHQRITSQYQTTNPDGTTEKRIPKIWAPS
jgi:hypothetical protein